MFKKLTAGLVLGLLMIVGTAHAEDKKAHVLSMMEKAVAHFQSAGKEQAFKDFDQPGDFKNGEFYVIAQALDTGNIIYHGVNKKLIGKNLNKIKDTDGKQFVQEMMDVANGPGKGWVDYKWPHPATKKIAQKHTYVTRVGDSFLMIGYYE